MNTTTVTTEDMILAAYLIASNHRLDSATVNSLGRGTFVFTGVADKTLLVFQAGGTCVEPHKFNSAVVELTRRCRMLAKNRS